MLIMLVKFCVLVALLTAQTTRAVEDEPSPCPNKCKCFWFKEKESERRDKVWVDCAGIPGGLFSDSYDDVVSGPDLPAETTAVDMAFNNISKVYATDITPTLTLLRLPSNVIQSLQKDSFTNFPNLQTLELMYNNISEIDAETFSALRKLRVLNLRTNAISHLPEKVFEQNAILEELYLSHNPLKILYREWFASLQQLQVLDLSQTQLYVIRPETLHPLRSLQQLDISGNMFTTVPTEALRSVASLEKVVLNGNPIRTLDESSFQQLSHVRQLEICHMEKLVEIREKTFRDMTGLQNLTISDNHDLSHMHDSAFYGMFNATHFRLRTLSLRKNSLTFLHSHTLPFDKLDQLEIQQNPWNCNCDFLWVAQCPAVVGDPRCSQPEKYRGIEVHHIQKKAFAACKKTPEEAELAKPASESAVMKTIVLLMVVTLMAVLGLSLALVLRKHDVLSRESRKGSGSIYYVKAHSNPLTDVPVGSLI